MLRFPNPGSTISNLVAVYTAVFQGLHDKIVDIDDIVSATVGANLATSSGYIGDEAIARSTRDDRSRDPLYNQLKMYAEIYRALGWLHPTENATLKFTFTLLGRQIVAAGAHYLPLLDETVVGICYPSHVLSIQGNYNLRPFSLILKTMLACDEALSRDELIVAPLCVINDRTKECLSKLVSLVSKARTNDRSIKSLLADVATTRGIQINTLQNYTRFPIAIMRDCGWTEKARFHYSNSNQTFEVHRLTVKGKELAKRLSSSTDIRIDQLNNMSDSQRTALIIHSHYQMLGRAGFDLASVADMLTQNRPAFLEALDSLGASHDQPLLFSPFQSLSVSEIKRIFPAAPTNENVGLQRIASLETTPSGRDSRDHLFVTPRFVTGLNHSTAQDAATIILRTKLTDLHKAYRTEKEAAQAFVVSRSSDTRTQFYPLISHLFHILGLKSDYSRAGVNYQRWDAFVSVDNVFLPIEIKSPTEERFLSTKAIRQALENKIILLSREDSHTHFGSTSLIVGLQIPSERGDMASLIDDIFSAFQIRIGVIDLATLTILAIRAATQDVTIDKEQLIELKGFLYV
jgi:hypothetical protein